MSLLFDCHGGLTKYYLAASCIDVQHPPKAGKSDSDPARHLTERAVARDSPNVTPNINRHM